MVSLALSWSCNKSYQCEDASSMLSENKSYLNFRVQAIKCTVKQAWDFKRNPYPYFAIRAFRTQAITTLCSSPPGMLRPCRLSIHYCQDSGFFPTNSLIKYRTKWASPSQLFSRHVGAFPAWIKVRRFRNGPYLKVVPRDNPRIVIKASITYRAFNPAKFRNQNVF